MSFGSTSRSSAPPDPFLIAADIFDPRPSSEQEAAQRDPVGWIRDNLGVDLWSKQRLIVESVRDNQRTSVRSCHGVGKTLTAAATVLWFLWAYEDSRVITTATTWNQITKLLWHELNQLHKRARVPLGGELLQTEWRLPDGRYAIGLSSKPEESESFAGHHAPNLLQVFDEASGVHEKIYEASEGHLTAAGARRLLIGNPTRTAGEFFNSHHKGRASYNTIHISAYDAPWHTGEAVSPRAARALLGRAWVEDKLAKWGRDNPLFQVRVLGNFPDAAENVVIPLRAIEEAQEREVVAAPSRDRVVVVCDVARFGDDETAIGVRVGNRVRLLETYVGKKPPSTASGAHEGDLVATAGRIIHYARQYPAPHVRIVIDDDGLGGGVTDILRNQGWEVTAFKGGERAYQPDDYPNRRSEMWFAASEAMGSLDLDGDDQLAADLAAPVYRFDGMGRRVVEPKADTKKRLGRSPDRGDMVLLALVKPTDVEPAPPMADAPKSLTGDLLNEPT